MRPLGILALVIMAMGFAIVFLSRTIVNKYDLAKKQTCEHEEEMSDEELEDYKINKAIFNIKLIGLFVSIPGLILFFMFGR